MGIIVEMIAGVGSFLTAKSGRFVLEAHFLFSTEGHNIMTRKHVRGKKDVSQSLTFWTKVLLLQVTEV